ncbi:hypothetical protein EJB05_34082, partial [Eragrostis curvula]
MAMPACNGFMVVLVVAMAATLSMASLAAGTLQYDFYSKTSCPKAEEAIHNATWSIIKNDRTMGAAFMRLFFHDCFVRGCDASVLLVQSNRNPQPERAAIPLRGLDVVDQIKTAVDNFCGKGVVSCADILAFAARDTVAIQGGFTFAMPGGRRDGLISSASDVIQFIPSPAMNADQLIQSFGVKGLSADDLVALSGAHSFGETHCSFVTPRLYPTLDPTMDATFAGNLKNACPRNSGGSRMLNMNNVSADPNVLSNQYYSNVLAGKVMFTSDQTLASSGNTASLVNQNAGNPVAWMAQFAAALVKMGQIEVLTGTAGEIRNVCSATLT